MSPCGSSEFLEESAFQFEGLKQDEGGNESLWKLERLALNREAKMSHYVEQAS